VATACLALSPFAPAFAGLLPECPFRALTGLPCPTCGASRAALLLARFEPVEAFVRFPLAALGWTVLIAGGLAAGVAALLGRGLPELPNRLSWPARIAVVAALLGNWVYLIATGA
jgi:hypothetical protein